MAFKPFEQMTEAERLDHMLTIHQLPDIEAAHGGLSDAEWIEAHQLDHDEYVSDTHVHSGYPALTRRSSNGTATDHAAPNPRRQSSTAAAIAA